MNHISGVGHVSPFKAIINFTNRINWRLVGKISLVAIGIFVLAATVYCLKVIHSVKHELTATQREHSQPLTDQKIGEWLTRIQEYLWPQVSLSTSAEWNAERSGFSRFGFEIQNVYDEGDAPRSRENGAPNSRRLVQRQPISQRRIDSSERVLQNIQGRLETTACQANPQRYWDMWMLSRSQQGEMCIFPDDTTADIFRSELGFTTTPRYNDELTIIAYRQPSLENITSKAYVEARIRVFVRNLLGLS